MCPSPEEVNKELNMDVPQTSAKSDNDDNNNTLLVGFCAVVAVTSLIAAIVIGIKAADSNGGSNAVQQIEVVQAKPPTIVVQTGDQKWATNKPMAGDNVCEGKKLELPNADCIVDALVNVGPQSGANVTKGYKGSLEVDHQPITTPYFQNGMCPVNVHWHLGTEHYSAGEYDETGTYPDVKDIEDVSNRKLAETAKSGYHCKLYNKADPKFNTRYTWKHCVGMVVGQTYEVHWPHSAAGACGTPNQYQTPFYDGVFCNLDMDTLSTLGPQDIASAVGVQAQVFTIVNDEDYYYPDLFRGMIVDGDMGKDIHYYTGSTTGTTRDNTICSSYSPITWQVDRKCHMISASTFDKMCADMKSQRDDMSDDLYAHGSRDLVDDAFVANNGQRQRNRNLRS